jgi:PBSX family phage terminase large subunit
MPSQTRAYKLQKKYKAFIGGVGSGKTYFGSLWATDQTLYKPGDGMIVAPTYRMLEDVSLRAYLDMLDSLNRPYNHVKRRQCIETDSGITYFRSAEHPDRLRGPNLSWLWGDEAALWREGVWKVLIGRLRLNDARALLTTTPSGFNWLYHYWIELANDVYGMITASTRENKYLDEDFVENLEASYTEEFAEQEIEGKFVTFEGLVYSEFSHDQKNGNLREFDIDPSWQRVRAIDFGYTNPFVCLWGAVDDDGRLWIYDEYYQRRRLISEHAGVIKDTDRGEFRWTVADWDAQDRAELEKAGVPTQKAQKEIMTGIQKVKARLKRQADGMPRLIIHQRCVNLLKEFSSYRWNPKSKGGKEEPIKELDHAMDALRYMVMEIDHGGFVIV